ncbi:hypothetical protein ACHAXS_011749 [Conticribra weissflogii]
MKALNEPKENHQHQISPQSSGEEQDGIGYANNKHFSEEENDAENDDTYDISSVSEEEREDIAKAPGSILNKSNNEFTSPSWTNMNPLHRMDKHIRPPQSQPMHSKSPVSSSKRHLGTVDHHMPPPSPGDSVASMVSNTSQTNSKSQSTPLTMPRFYDSEDEGHGSLVFVGDEPSTSQPPTPTQSLQFRLSKILSDSSENASGSRPTKVLSSPTKDRKNRNPPASTDTNPAQMLPYHQRRKLNMTEQQSDRPPSPPDSSPAADLNISPGVSGERKSLTQIRPPFHPKPSSVPRDKFKIAQIPPFRGSDGGRESRQSTAERSESDSFVRNATNPTSPQSSTDKKLENSRPPLSRSSSPKQIRSSSSTHDVICPPQPPIPHPQSPRSGSYHIRIQSQGSISSLGSHAGVDSDCDYTNAPPFQHISHQQMQQNILPSNYYHGYSQQQQSQQPPPPQVNGLQRNALNATSVNFNDILGQDIATFLHGEQIAAATGNVGRQHMGEYPHPSHWNPTYGGVHPGWIGGNPYSSNPNYYPAARPEPPPPPLTAVPNMNLHRARLPSISDDDWAEEFEKVNKEREDDEGEKEFDRNSETKRNNDRHDVPPPPPQRPQYHHQHHPPPRYYSSQNQVARDYYSQHPDLRYSDVRLGYPVMGDQYNRITPQETRLPNNDSHRYYQYPQQAIIQGDYVQNADRGAPHIPHERSSLLAHESRNGNIVMMYNGGNYHSHENYPENMDTKSSQEADRERRRKKKKSKRRREKVR